MDRAFKTIGVLAVLALPLLDPLTRARIGNVLLFEWGAPLLILAATAFICLALGTAGKEGLAIFLAIAGVASLSIYGGVRAHETHLYYASTVVESADPLPNFSDRAPQQVAARQATSSLSGINGTPERTAYLPAAGDYTTLVSKPGWFNPGYTALVSQEIALTGQAKGRTCRFDEAAEDRMGGFFRHSLTREIAAIDSGLIAKDEDAWAYCDEDTPKVVVPVTKLANWLRPVHVPAGVAVYDGKSGHTEILSDKDAEALPGPTVGIRYSERVNASLKTWGGSWWTMLMKQSGLTDEVKDEDDTNALNASNFALESSGRNAYVSPFTSRAASVTVDAVAVLDGSHTEAGKAPAVTLHKLAVPRASNASTADRIKSDFASLPGWATGLQIQEIVPAADGVWAASIGLNQNVTHRVLVKDDGSSCLQDARGNVLRCSGDPEQATTAANPGSDVAVPDDISSLSNEKLAELQEIVTAEVNKRLRG